MPTTHVALYDKTTGAVAQLFARTTSDDAADVATNGYLTIDGVVVAHGIDPVAMGAVALDTPTADDVTATPFAIVVDDPAMPTDTAYLTTVGERDAGYFGDTDSEGLIPMDPP